MRNIIRMNFYKYEDILLQEYNNSSLKKSEMFMETYGLKFLCNEYDEIDTTDNLLVFEIVDIYKWTLAKIKYGI